ncbi:GNAT family N-acetyltransferase [Bacillus sp. es.034]|jgi:ribosomal protein S18 acetylase RimI-like enzyme|uniref:GNAT family N-acetyltransferase n=1 Tax=Bacillus sp. es.034 TaxID=1761763 RepID=UPI000BF8757D|nr:GNAT family N-acetyltransferase [Bacillus sp. es.034]PFG07573.1 acetyltransferase (GNAT) family protein [Bacillus sp. es.034]
MNLQYEVIPEEKAECCRDLCNELMDFQKSKASIAPERFDTMNFDTRMLPSIKSAIHNYLVIVKDPEKNDEIIAYVYTNISPKEAYSNDFATFFDLSSVKKENVGCLSQFYIKEGYRQYGIGSKLFTMSMEWLRRYENVEDYFVFTSNGNQEALAFYKRKGFSVSHDILDGFITVLRSKRE